MQICIFDTQHFETAYPLIRLFDVEPNQITIITNETCYRQFQYLLGPDLNTYKWVVRKDNFPKYQLVYHIYKEAKTAKFDIIFLNTVSDNFILYWIIVLLLKEVRIILTLHDINTFLTYRPALSFRRLVRYTGKRNLIKALSEFNVISVSMVDYLKARIPGHKKVHCLPGALFEKSANSIPEEPPADHIRIVVPGTVDIRRRNYDVVFTLLDTINQRNIGASVTLLGGTDGNYGNGILTRCREYNQKYTNLLFYDRDMVDQPEFDRVMIASHLVLLPSVINTVISDGVPETYGESKSSGNIFDIIKYAKPFMAPVALKVEPF